MIHDSYFLPQIASFFEQESLKREISLPLPQQFGECQNLLFSPSFTVWLDAHHHVEVSAKAQ